MDGRAIAQRYCRERDHGRHPSVPDALGSDPGRYGIVTAMTAVWPRRIFCPYQ